MDKNNLNFIKNIKSGWVYTFNVSNDELYNSVNSISTKEEMEALPIYFLENINENLFNILSNKTIGDKGATSLLSYDQINALINGKLNLLDNENFLRNLNPLKMDWKIIKALLNKIKNKSLIKNLDPIIIKKIINPESLDQNIIKNITKEQISNFKDINNTTLNHKFFEGLFENNKIFELNDDALNAIRVEMIKNIDKNCFNNLVFEKNFDNFNNDVKKFIFDSLDLSRFFKSNDFLKIESNDFFKFITLEQIKNIDKNYFVELSKSAKFDILDEEIKIYIAKNINLSSLSSSKIDNIISSNNLNERIISNIDARSLESLNQESINKIINFNPNKIKQNKIDNSVLSFDDLQIESEPPIGDIVKTINRYVSEENFNSLKINCIRWAREDKNKVLNTLRNLKFKDNFYGKIHEVEVLNNIIMLENNSYDDYLKIVDKVKYLSKTTPNNIDEHFCKAELLLKMSKDANFNNDFLESISEEAVISVESCINGCYGFIEKDSMHNDLRDLYVDALLSKANIIGRKYNINESSLLDKSETSFTNEEKYYIDTLRKAYNYRPDSVTKVKSFLTPIISIGAKTAATYVVARTTKSVTDSNLATAAVGLTGLGIVGKQIYDEVDKNRFFNNRKEYHNYRVNKEYGFLKKTWISVKNKFDYTFVDPIRNYFLNKRISKGEKIDGISGYLRKEDLLDSSLYSNNVKKTGLNDISDFIEKQKDKTNKFIIDKYSSVDNKHIKIINSYSKIKEKALELKYKRDLEKVYEQFPELKKNKSVGFVDCLKGFVSSIFDVSTIGFGSSFVKSDTKLLDPIRYKDCFNRISELNEKYKNDLQSIKNEQSLRLSNLNKDDKINFDKFEKDISSYSNVFSINPILEIVNNSNVRIKQVRDINKKIKSDGLLESISNFKDKNISNTYSELMSLFLNDNISNEIKFNNANLFFNNLEKQINSGLVSEKFYKPYILPIVSSMNFIKIDDDLFNKLLDNKFINDIEPDIKNKIHTFDNISKLNSKRKDNDFQMSI